MTKQNHRKFLTPRRAKFLCVATIGFGGFFASGHICVQRATPDWEGYKNNTSPNSTVGLVATGTHQRVREGLLLLQEGKISRLHISGIDSHRVLECVWRRNPDIDRLTIGGKVSYDFQIGAGLIAQNTEENAQIGLSWLQDQHRKKQIKNCVLITSEKHMTRFTITLNQQVGGLGRLAPPVKYLKHPVRDGWSQTPFEEIKTVATAWGKASNGSGQQLGY